MPVLMRLLGTAFFVFFLFSCVPPNGSLLAPPPDQAQPKPVTQNDVPGPGPDESSNPEPQPRLKPQPQPQQATKPQPQQEPVSAGELVSDDPPPSDLDSTGGEESERHPAQNNQQALMDEALDFLEQAQALWEKGEPDNALKLLDEAYSLLLDVNGDPEIAWQKDDLRIMIAKKIVEIYTSRTHVAAGYQSEIPLVMNDDVKTAIKRFQRAERRFFLSSYKRSGRYRPMILEQLKEAGLPEELSWLPLVESGFKIKALSKARALGLWQIIPSTGYRYGLKRDLWIDERMDAEKSTQAALAYLKELHGIFGDWLTVLAAYNCGEGRVLKAISRQQMNYLDNFWDLYRQLPFETSNYVPRFLATLHILKDPGKYGFDLAVDQEEILSYETVRIEKSISLKDLAKALDVPSDSLESLNAELRYKTTPQSYDLKIPAGMTEQLARVIDTVAAAKKPGGPRYIRYKVKRGDTLSVLARRYKSSINAILAANHLTSKHRIRAGRWIKIPSRGYVYAEQHQSRVSRGGDVGTYRVQKGDSLWLIAKRFGTTISEIKRLNGLQRNDLSIGQILKVRGSAEGDGGGPAKTYTVQRGDTLSTIAHKHGVGLSKLLRLNRLGRRSLIHPGQVVVIR